MSWKRIIGHDREKGILQRSILNKRLPSAYLFYGNEGVGKYAMALQIAKTMNCENVLKNENYIDSCDKCKSCLGFDNLSHPNLYLIYSLPTPPASSGKDNDDPFGKLSESQIEEIKEQLYLKSKDYYHRINLTKANQIKISSIRNIKKELSFSASKAGRRFVIVIDAHEMTTESSNAFLKSLEEPHQDVTIILLTSRKDAILPTILSRCRIVKFNPIDNELIKEKLIKDYQIDESKATLAASLSDGSLSKALENTNDEVLEFRNFVVDVLRTSFRKNKFRIELIDKVNELITEKDKNKMINFLKYLKIWLKDAALISVGANKALITNKDKSDIIHKFAFAYGESNFEQAIEEIDNSSSQIYSNVNPNLIFLSLFIKLREIFLA